VGPLHHHGPDPADGLRRRDGVLRGAPARPHKGVLHLDVKPDNLMFDAESAVKVTDFGIARVISGGRTMGTVDGQVLGTPAYMSPEQARGEELTAASDVYASGVMLYELLSGQLPWQGAETAAELLRQRLDEDPIPCATSTRTSPSRSRT
jgi:eukaryotic-like serine/threonine-protein kinase